MKDIPLFHTAAGPVTSSQVVAALEQVKAHEARVLYMHTGINFGSPDPKLGREPLLAALFECVRSLGVPTVVVPTFTFSFCNGEDYDVQRSRSRMGALNEYIRKLPETVRSVDPLMSAALVGEDRDLVEDLGKHSIGSGSTFDKLHGRGSAAKFLFLGASMSECFTYSHYVEERLDVPYRYRREFTGRITDVGRTWEDTYTLYVRYKGVVVSEEGKLEKDLAARGMLRTAPVGAGFVCSVDEPDAYETILRHLREDVYCYTAADPRDHNTEFVAQRMVAL